MLAVLGLILSVIFGGFTIWAYWKPRRELSLEFQNEQCYSLFRDDINQLNLNIYYKDSIIKNNIILLRASILNNGLKDIDESLIHKPLAISAVGDFNWLEVNVLSSPHGTDVNVTKSIKQIEILWDLLKPNEKIVFEALIEVKGSSLTSRSRSVEFFNSLTFDFRIKDIKNINKSNLVPNRERLKANFNKYFTSLKIIITLSALILFSLAIFPNFSPFDNDLSSSNQNQIFWIFGVIYSIIAVFAFKIQKK